MDGPINTLSVYIGPMFPAQATSQVSLFVGFGALALLIVLLTRGRLGYDRLLCSLTTGVGSAGSVSILRCWLRFRPGCFPGARPLLRFYAPFTRDGRGFLLFTRLPPSRFFAFLTQLLLAQISPKLFISKTAA
jgi:hypothetical protein